MAARKKARPRHDDGRPNAAAAAPEGAAIAEPGPERIVESPAASTRSLLLAACAIALLHAFACAWLRNLGFDHISDDDFSRVVIAQGFAHHARLDPSGTSWLPFPFWILGLGMKLLGRDLATARALSILFSSLAAPLPFVALRLSGVPWPRAFVALVFALGTPWMLWSGATTVPESFTAALTAAGVLGLATVAARARDGASPTDLAREKTAKTALREAAPLGFGAALFAACLSRYEAWPAAAVAAIWVGVTLRRSPKRPRLIVAAVALCVAGPLMWMAWNAHAHDGPLHFFRRVSTYKRAIGDGATSWASALFFYPKLLFAVRPEVTLPALVLSPLAFVDRQVRRRWGLPLLAAFAQLAFLSIGNARDGAPAHHAERALLGGFVIFALFLADVVLTPWIRTTKNGETKPAIPKAQKAFGGFIAIAWLISLLRADGTTPGMHPSEARTEQIERGTKLRKDGVKPLTVTPCGYEHFALVAAYGAPEQVTVNPAHFDQECPKVETP
ncbi:MAG: hypothetical protein KIT84_20920 [Labilithrix sp.]|nr:hypothetical protein [Labilithrix sp.]MCW5813505.1 hypothetical protein [Labilithrix sp.]